MPARANGGAKLCFFLFYFFPVVLTCMIDVHCKMCLTMRRDNHDQGESLLPLSRAAVENGEDAGAARP